MSDITTAWDVVNGRGDWVFNPPTLVRTPMADAAAVVFGYGDGVTTNFQLVPGQNTVDTIVAQIFRNDWQGNQLLYASPRTNFLTNSSCDTNAGWNLGANAVRVGNTTAPDGSNTATIYQGSASAPGNQYVGHPEGVTLTAGATYTASVWAKLVSGSAPTIGQILTVEDNLSPNHREAVNFNGSGIGTAWKQFSATFQAQASTTGGTFYTAADYGQGVQVALWGAQLESGSLTSYIPTITAPVTVTDYTISPYGLVTLASPPILGAILSRVASYVSNAFVGSGDLESGNDLATAYLISLFTDRQAQVGDVIPDGTNDARGWIGDAGQKYLIGSRLWLLERAKQTPQTLNNARAYVTEAVQWLIDDNVVSKHDITVQWIGSGKLGIWIQAYRPDGSKFPSFTWVWQGIQ